MMNWAEASSFILWTTPNYHLLHFVCLKQLHINKYTHTQIWTDTMWPGTVFIITENVLEGLLLVYLPQGQLDPTRWNLAWILQITVTPSALCWACEISWRMHCGVSSGQEGETFLTAHRSQMCKLVGMPYKAQPLSATGTPALCTVA